MKFLVKLKLLWNSNQVYLFKYLSRIVLSEQIKFRKVYKLSKNIAARTTYNFCLSFLKQIWENFEIKLEK